MTQEEFNNTNWHRGNIVRLNNGKEYLCKGMKSHGKYLLLFSVEYEKCFVADYQIIDCRTSDYEEPEEVYLQHKAEHRAKAEAAREAERQERLRKKEALKQQHLKEQEEAHARKLVRKMANQHKDAKGMVKVNVRDRTAGTGTKTNMAAEPVAKTKPAPVATVVETKSVTAAPSREAAKKRVRQRVRITKKVEF